MAEPSIFSGINELSDVLIGQIVEKNNSAYGKATEIVVDLLAKLKELFKHPVKNLQKIISKIREIMGRIWEFVKGIPKLLFETFLSVRDYVTEKVESVTQTAQRALAVAMGKVYEIIDVVRLKISDLTDTVTSRLTDLETFISQFDDPIEFIGGLLADAW